MAAEWFFNSIAIFFFVLAALFYKLGKGNVHYSKMFVVCLAFCLLPIASFINVWLAYALQFILLVGLARAADKYFREGLFRRRKELYEMFHSNDNSAKKEFYYHLKHLSTHEREILSEKERIEKMKKELEEEKARISAEKEALENQKKALKDMHLDIMAIKEDKK